MKTNLQNIENLLSQTSTITNSYKRVQKATGENFNIFSVLGIEHYEESTHSRFIAELLNPNGRHGFDNLFLIKFLDLLGIDNNFFDVNNYRVETEFFIGNVTETTGGRIDILLTDNNNGSQVMIENKIYAAEQPNQLLRYYNYNQNAKLLYLTLYGNDSQQDSEQENKENKEKIYTNVSYSEFIVLWLEECQKIAVENPIVRETIRQYKNLVKKLTYQNTNQNMNNELLKAIVSEGKKENFESLISLVNLTNDIFKVAVENHLYPTLDKLLVKHNLTTTLEKEKFVNKNYEWLGFSIQSEKMSKHNLQIGFAFNTKRGANSLIIGFGYINQDIKNDFNYSKLIQNYENYFSGKREETGGWPAFQYFNGYRNWENLNDLKEVIHGNFKNDFTNKIETLLKIVDESF